MGLNVLWMFIVIGMNGHGSTPPPSPTEGYPLKGGLNSSMQTSNLEWDDSLLMYDG